VFPDGDFSPAPIESGLMRRVIELAPSGRTLVQHGMRDFILLAQGSALAIQNMTWHGKQGFQTKPTRALLTVNGSEWG
jgi:carboxypeptidase D